MEFQLVQRQPTEVLGYTMLAVPSDPKIAEMWCRVHENGDFDRLMKKSAKCENFGLCIMEDGLPEGLFTYMIAVDAAPDAQADPDMRRYTVAGGEYAVFRAPSMDDIKPLFKQIYEEWLPSSNYAFDKSRSADFEYYTMQGDDVTCDIYTPVVQK